MHWQSVALSRQAHRARTIAALDPPVPDVPRDLPLNVSGLPAQLLHKDVVEITSLKPEELLRKLATGALKSVHVTNAYLQRAALASKLTNCVTELLPERALERAKYLDNYLEEHKRPIGPLHGLPISVKEHVSMKGLDLNAGFVSWVGRIAKDDALVLKLLWNAGALFHARTTEPQTLMHLETSNNIFGETVNSFNTNLSAGGSSGGEGALIGFKGSCLGIGTDIGGSIRNPAANNGVYGLRPTSYRLPMDGLAATMLGQEHIVAVIGPLSQSLEGIKLFMRSIIDQQPWLYDPSLIPIPWKDTSHSSLLRKGPDGRRKLRIGVLADDGIVKPHPPILRGIRTLTEALRRNPDFELIDFPPHRHDEAWRIISSLYFADGAREETEAIDASGEPWRPLSNFIIKENPNVKTLSVPEVWKLTQDRDAYRESYTRHWNSVGTGLPGPGSSVDAEESAAGTTVNMKDEMVDVILCPVGPGCAPPLNCARYWSYTSLYNLLDYPSLVFPTGLKAGPEDAIEEGYEPRNEQDRYNYKLCKCFSLVGRRYEDEKVIEALDMILRSLP